MERRSKFDATLVFQDEAAAFAVAGAFEEVDVPPAMRSALETMATVGNRVTFTFHPVEAVELEDIGDGRLTACLLYTSQGDPD